MKPTETQESEQFSEARKREWQSRALVFPTKTRVWLQLMMTLNQLKRHVRMSRWGTTKMKNHWKRKFQRQDWIPWIQIFARSKNMKTLDVLFHRSWCVDSVGSLGVSWEHVNKWCGREEVWAKKTCCCFRLRFHDKNKLQTCIKFLLVETVGFDQIGTTCCDRKRPDSVLHWMSSRFHQRSWVSHILFGMRQGAEHEISWIRSDSSTCRCGSDSKGPT